MKRASISMCDLRNQEWNKDDMMLSPSMKKKKDKSKKKTKASPQPLEGRVAKDKKKSPKAALDVPFVYVLLLLIQHRILRWKTTIL